MKHTPGPWEVAGTEIWAGSKRITMGRGAHDEKEAAVRNANACLIAAAPELLSELIAYHDREWREDHEGIPAHHAGDFPDECGACAVIVKATGGE